MAAVLAAAVVSGVLGAVSVVRQVHLAPYAGLYISAERGMLRVNVFDPYVWGIRYPRGLSTEAGDGTVAWKPLIFKNQESGLNVNVDVPLWGLCVVLGGAWALLRSWGWAYHAWQCGRCGYDVRGLTGGRCPECGTGVDAAMRT